MLTFSIHDLRGNTQSSKRGRRATQGVARHLKAPCTSWWGRTIYVVAQKLLLGFSAFHPFWKTSGYSLNTQSNLLLAQVIL